MSRYIVYFHPGNPVPDRLKYVDDATTAPDADDDAATLGVTIGSLWLDTVAGKVYVCQDASTGAAVWIDLTAVTTGDLAASNAVGPLLIADDHSTPLVFADILLTEDESDFLYADP